MENIITKKFIEETRKLFKKGIKLNPNDEVAESVLEECLIIERKKTEYVFFEDPIMDLIKNYNIDTFTIGRIHFYTYEKLEITEEYIIIGFDGTGDLVAINKNSNKICCIDGYYEWLMDCSGSSQEFLDNLIKIGNAYISRFSNNEKYKLVEEMGDDKNISFYLEALGVIEE